MQATARGAALRFARPAHGQPETFDFVCDFLEVAMHAILYERNLYPRQIFERREKYSIPVWMSRHPDLNTYIREAIDAARPWLTQAFVAVISSGALVLERYVFEFAEPTQAMTLTAAELEEQFRAFLLRLATYQGPHKQLPLDSVFSIEVQKLLPNDQLQQWIPAPKASTVDCEVRPLRSLDTGIVQFQLVVESSLATPQPAEVKSPVKKAH